jgi:polar amino acid transport system substrate-binding protein
MNWTMRTVVGSFVLLAAGQALAADVMDTIKSRGTLIVGVKPDYKPFGFRDPNGTLIGIEPDLAADLAKRLGVKIELVPVLSSNRIEFLQQGKIDVVVATMSDTPERRKVVQAIDPPYYSDFANVMLSKKSGVTKWEELKGKPICATSAAWYNKEIARKYTPELAAFDGSEKPLFALKQGNCIGYVYDQTFLQGKLLDPEWSADYALPLPGILDTPWIMAVAQGQDALKTFLENATKDWMKTGAIVALENKWGIKPTEYSTKMHEKFKAATN